MHRYQTIPRFSIDYGAGDFFAALPHLFSATLPEPRGILGVAGGRQPFWTGSGRQALWLILTALELKKGSGVAIPMYGDRALPEAIVRAGCKPVFVDVEEASLTMDAASLHRVRDRISAVVPVHFFGQVADMPAILDVAGSLPVIEDTVHAPFSFLNGRMAGQFGIAGFYSFGSTKPCPAGGGGLAVINDPEFATKVAAVAETLTPAPPLQRCRNFMVQAAKVALLHRPVYGLAGRTARLLLESRKPLEPVLCNNRIAPHQAVLALRQAARLRERVEQQRRNSLQMISRLAGLENIGLPQQRPGARNNFHLFPVLLSNAAESAAVARQMLSRNVDASRMYWDIEKQAREFGYEGGCPVSESVAGRMVTLPNGPDLSPQELMFVADAFADCVRGYRARNCSVPAPSRSSAGDPVTGNVPI